ncbi:MAG: hypothetical protein NTW96_17540 [Planctomycetia bacterium]|nr:hypothetical protein [Planctomycetia bacterium]
MPQPIDTYHQWLGIPPGEQPPNAYRLLGVRLFEADLGVIRTAADRQMLHLRTYQLGEYSDLSQRLLNEVASARARLLDPKRKAEYDRRLSSQLQAATPAPAEPPSDPMAELLSQPEPTAWLVTPKPAPRSPLSSLPRHRRPARAWPKIVAAAVVVLLVVLAVWWLMPGGDRGESATETTAAARPFDEVFGEAAGLGRNGHGDQAIALLERYMETAEGDDWRRGQTALSEMKEAVSAARAMEFWSRYKTAELADFQEKGRLPETCWLEKWGSPIATPGIEEVWRATLRQTLPAAVASSESRPKPILIVTRLLPVENWPDPAQATAAEDVDSSPGQFYGKLVYFDDVGLGAGMTQGAEQGFLLDVTSAAGNRFPARASGDTLVFATQQDVFQQLKQRLAGEDRIRARLYCRIDKGKKMAPGELKTFPKAMVYKLELYPSP